MTDAAPSLGRWDFDDDLIAGARADGRPRVRAHPWPLPGAPAVAIVIGRGGQPGREVHLGAARADGVPVMRRRGGGCAVVLDPGNVIVSLVLPQEGIGGITAAFAAISARLIAALARCGVPNVEQAGTSDLALAGRKIGGSCLWRTKGLAYYSATLLVRPDLALVDRYLPHPPREPAYRRQRSHRDFLATLQDGEPALTSAILARRLSSILP